MLNLLKNSLFYRRCTILHSHLQSVRITFFFQLCWVFIAACRLFSSCSEWWLLSSCSAQASHCSGFSCCGAQALRARASVVAGSRLRSCGLRALEHRLRSPGARPSCSVACRIFPEEGLNLCPLIGRQILIHCATREVLMVYFDALQILILMKFNTHFLFFCSFFWCQVREDLSLHFSP